jgi:hypothetical protein
LCPLACEVSFHVWRAEITSKSQQLNVSCTNPLVFLELDTGTFEVGLFSRLELTNEKFMSMDKFDLYLSVTQGHKAQ